MRRRRDDDSFATSTQCDASSQVDASSQADLSQADVSQADISQTESKADSMRTRPARKRRKTITDAPQNVNFEAMATNRPLQNMRLSQNGHSLPAGPVSGDDEQSLTSASSDEQLQSEMVPAHTDRAVTLEVVYGNGATGSNGHGQPHQHQHNQNHHHKSTNGDGNGNGNSHIGSNQNLNGNGMQAPSALPASMPAASVAAAAGGGGVHMPHAGYGAAAAAPPLHPSVGPAAAARYVPQPIPSFGNGQFASAAVQDDSAINTSYSRPTNFATMQFSSQRQRSNSLPNEFDDDDDNAMDTS